ncbi:MAG: methyl-accepting chemotaxis protein [Synergistaceae bacterium]|jgi:methyl-accepting chemotaxis protein|nr:methyl-accepting chemotaxis protein [Synergistaceae bacterium]
MQWFKNLRTVAKILTLVFAMTVLMLVVSITGYRTSSKIASGMEEMYQNYAMSAIWMAQTKALAIQNRRMLITMTIVKSETERADYERRIAENQQEASGYIEKYDRTPFAPGESTLREDLKRNRDEAARKRAEMLSVLKASDELTDEFLDRLRGSGDIAVAENNYIATLDKLEDFLVGVADKMNADARENARLGAVQIAVSSVAAILLGLAMGVAVARMITNPLGIIQRDLKTLAEGDITMSFDASGKDEIAQMGGSLQFMVDKLNEIFGSMKDASNHISETAQEFSALAEETNASVEGFRANVDEMGSNLNALASTGEEVNASVEEVAAGAQATAERGTDIARQVDEAMNAGDSGMNAVRNVVSGIEGVASNAANAARSVQELGVRTRQIQGFVAQIGGIADQTNLLALNAAIEAARAGEAGRGFAVVAEEVRKLAEESNVAAKSIAELAETITGDLDSVVGISLENEKASQSASDLSRETESIIASMITYLKNISGATQDLAAVSQEQAASSEEIAEAVQSIAARVGNAAEAGDNIRDGVGGVATATERIAQGAEMLSGLAGDLMDLIAFIKMEERAVKKTPGTSRIKALPPRK